jgi:hypothetical protein
MARMIFRSLGLRCHQRCRAKRAPFSVTPAERPASTLLFRVVGPNLCQAAPRADAHSRGLKIGGRSSHGPQSGIYAGQRICG